DQVLRSAVTTVEQAFSQYSLWLLLSGERNDGLHFPVADKLNGVTFLGDYEARPAGEIQTTPVLAPMGTAFVRFDADGSEGGLRLGFEGEAPGSFQAQVLLTPRKNEDPLVRAVVSIDSRGRGSIGIPWATYREGVLIIGH